MTAFVRRVAGSFAAAITMQSPAAPIQLAVAQAQHQAYTQALRSILGPDNVLELPADDDHPDCCFVEDTAVVVGRTAVVASIGAGPRRGEEVPVAAALQGLGYQLQHIQPPATLDGGDVLQLPGSSRLVLVGLSRRTNAAAVRQLQAALPSHTVAGVRVEHGLHLKSAVTALDARTLLYADNEAGRALRAQLEAHPALAAAAAAAAGGDDAGSGAGGGGGAAAATAAAPWQHVMVDPAHANVLLLGGGHVVAQPGPPASRALLGQLAAARGLRLHEVDFSEFAKADGSLTCASILLPPAASGEP